MITIATTHRAHRGTLLMSLMWLVLSGCGRATVDPADASTPPLAEASSTDGCDDAAQQPDVISPVPSDASGSDISDDAVAHEPDVTSPDAGIPSDASDTRSADMSADAPTTDSRAIDTRTDRALECTPEAGDRLCCTEDQPVWDGSTFSYAHSLGAVSPPPIYAGCSNARLSGTTERYNFSTADETLIVHRCANNASRLLRIVYLTRARFDAIVAAVNLIRTTCVLQCLSGADYTELAVPATGLGQTYISDDRTACGNPARVPPFVAHDGLFALGRLLEETADTACRGDAGVDAGADAADPAEVGSCGNVEGGI
ncbi:MAG TPA: hypothetical protein VK550_24830 [Polyangiaceae bacterium]|nr:hypothetical protein [Polyangiaceae bacterium]